MTTKNEDADYEAAVAALLSPAHQAATPAAIRAAAARRRNTLRDMRTYLRRLGLDVPIAGGASAAGAADDGGVVRAPPLIFHVAGTKGKGSTLSAAERLLRDACGLNTGMFTSPHLVSVRERIRINGVPISKKAFGRVYWTVRRRLEAFADEDEGDDNDDREGGADPLPPPPLLPGYFRMLTLMALYAFCHCDSPRIDAVLLEVGVGGRYDATNVFEPHRRRRRAAGSPPMPPSSSAPPRERLLVRGVTLIDYDHTRVLGSTLAQIAWEKGGIFVRDKLENIGTNDGGYDSFCAEAKVRSENQSNRRDDNVERQSSSSMVFVNGDNVPEVSSVLHRISDANGCHLQVVHGSSLNSESFPNIGLEGDHQRSNAALALAMCRYAMERISPRETYSSLTISEEKLKGALEKAFWPGRCHTVMLPYLPSDGEGDANLPEVSTNLRCDGAHTPISINACIDWFRQVVGTSANSSPTYDNIHRGLIFNCSHERNPLPLLFSLYHSNLFHSVYFCKADFERPSAEPKRLEDSWSREPLKNERFYDGVPMTLEDMCAEVRLQNDGNFDPAKLSASTWQETLANLWQVFDLYQRNCAGGHPPSHSSIDITSGLNVKDALVAMQQKAVSATNDATVTKHILVEACITGSLYIVGSALEAAGWEEEEAIANII